MRKASPNLVVDDFIASASDSLRDWQRIDVALANESIALRRRAASDSFLALAVTWESFISEWLVAAVNKDASQAVAHLTAKMTSHGVDELRLPSTHIAATLITQGHFNLASVKQILDPNDSNIVVRHHKDLKTLGDRWLAPPYHGALTGFSAHQFAPALATRLVRNVLAHNSDRALSEANDILRKPFVPAALRVTNARRPQLDGWRRYLLAPHGGHPRVAILHTSLSTIAGQLRVP